MRQTSGRTTIATRGKGMVDFTKEAVGFVEGSGIVEGLLTLF